MILFTDPARVPSVKVEPVVRMKKHYGNKSKKTSSVVSVAFVVKEMILVRYRTVCKLLAKTKI